MKTRDTRNGSRGVLVLAALATATLAYILTPANAAVIAIPTANVTASSEIPLPFDRIDDHLVDGSGLIAGGHTGTPDGFMWLSTGTCCGGVDSDPSVTFDLGAVHTINSFHVWNYNEASGGGLTERGVNAVTVEYGTTPALGSTVPGVAAFTKAPEPVSSSYAGEDFSGFTTFKARYIKFDIDSNHGGDNSFYGLSEVQFDVEPIAGVTIEDFSSQLSGFGGRLAEDTINGSGFTAATGVHDTGAENMWLTDGPFENDEGNDVLPSHITYDLGDNYDLNSFTVWNYNEATSGLTSRGAQDVEISVASSEGGPFVSLGDFVFDRAPGTTSNFGQIIDLIGFSAADNVRLLRLDITSNYSLTEGVVGLSEIRFVGIAVIPEPSNFVLGALGLLGLISFRRRRRNR